MKHYQLKEYGIYIGDEVLDVLLEQLIEAEYSQVFVLVDEHTEKYCLPLLQKTLFDTKVITLKSGEEHKTIASLQHIWEQLLAHEADRHTVFINLGGGVLGDIGGFAAATYKRGIDFIQIPTTLLAMVDSSIGGKLGVDYQHIKNVVGVFKNPKAVYIKPDFLNTLPDTELRNGFAEIIKHGLVADEDYWQKTQKVDALNSKNLSSLIAGSVKIKTQIVKKDPHENDLRKVLNFGHTIGHAIETYSLVNDKKPLKHGDAVAIGMVCEAFLSKEYCGLSGRELRNIAEFITKHFPKYSLRNILSPELIKYMRNDKKNSNNSINFTQLKKIGKATINHTYTQQQISLALNYYDSL